MREITAKAAAEKRCKRRGQWDFALRQARCFVRRTDRMQHENIGQPLDEGGRDRGGGSDPFYAIVTENGVEVCETARRRSGCVLELVASTGTLLLVPVTDRDCNPRWQKCKWNRCSNPSIPA